MKSFYLIRSVLLILPSLIADSASSQSRELIVIIDTISTSFKTLIGPELQVLSDENMWIKNDIASYQTLSINGNLSCKYKISLNSENDMLAVPIDRNGSHIMIKNLFSQKKDTIQISKLEILQTIVPDSTFTTTTFTKVINGSLADTPYMVDVQESGTAYLPPPHFIYLIVNGAEYEVPMKLKSSQSEVKSGHAYKPRRHLNKKGNYKKNVTYIYFNEIKYRYYWEGEILFKL